MIHIFSRINISILLLLLLPFISFSNPLSFEKTSPVENVDSLEYWLEKNPIKTTERLVNLIKIERSFYWNNTIKIGKYLPEIISYKVPGNKKYIDALVWYLKSINYIHLDKNDQAFHAALNAIKKFEELGDAYASFFASCLLIKLRFDNQGNNLLDKSKIIEYHLKKIEKDTVKFRDLDAQIHAKKSIFIHDLNFNRTPDGKSMEKDVFNIISFIDKNLKIRYAKLNFERFLSLSMYYQGKFKDSYNLNKRILNELNDSQIEERIALIYNLSIDCINLEKYRESYLFGKQALGLLNQFNSNDYATYEGIYSNLTFVSNKLGYHDQVFVYADSALVFVKENNRLNQIKALNELEQKYENEKNQLRIKELEEQRTRYKIFAIGGISILILIGYLSFKIFKANQSLQKLVRLRDEFIQTIAHDLRRPMHAFTGLSETFSRLLSKGDEESIQKIAQSIDSSGLAVRQTLDNLLYWALSERNSLGVQKIDFCLVAQLKSVISLFSGVSSINNQRIQFKGPDQLIVNSDPNAISLIVRNLLDNATKFTPAGGIIKIEVFVIDSFVSIQIFNSGKGMEISQLNEIKTLLNQKTISRNFQKIHGLGLTMVQLHAKMLNIKINVSSSSENQGTIFCIEGITKVNND